MKEQLKEKTKEALTSVLPITTIVLLLSFTLVPMETGTLFLFLAGALLLIVGMGFFQLGAEMAMTPLGQGIGSRLMKGKKIWLIAFVCFLMGAVITIAEPDLQVLAHQVASVPNLVLIYTIAVGVGIFLVIAFLRILFKISLSKMLTALYILLFILSFFAPDEFTAVAFDSGGVTTGPMTVPFIMALGVGLSAARSDKDSTNDSFGLVALCSVGPVIMVLLLGIFITRRTPSITPPNSRISCIQKMWSGNSYPPSRNIQKKCLSAFCRWQAFLCYFKFLRTITANVRFCGCAWGLCIRSSD